MGLPNPSRETKFSGANADMEIFIFPVQLTTYVQDWQLRVAKKWERTLKWEWTATVLYVFKSAPSGGIYTTTACSSDVCNIPTNGHFFVFSQ